MNVELSAFINVAFILRLRFDVFCDKIGQCLPKVAMFGVEEGKLLNEGIHFGYFAFPVLCLGLCTLFLVCANKVPRSKYKAQSSKAEGDLAKLCFTLRHKRLISLAIVRMLHTDRLSLCFTVQRCLEVHVQLAIEHLLSLGQRETGTLCQSQGKLCRGGFQLVRRNDPIVQANSLGFRS